MSLETESQAGSGVGAAPPDAGRPARGIWAAALASALLLVAVAAPFLRAQALWADEVTQLSGLSLPPVEVARWLAGEDPGRFGVMPDRMPPLSYWSGWAWSRAFGASEGSFRWMGVVVTACGAACVALAAGRLAGGLGALAAGLLFALSPNVMTMAPEIRAYPFLMAFASAAFLCLIGYARARREAEARWLVGCLACGLAAIYSHFFGLVLGGAVFASATLVALAGRRRVVPPILGGVLLLALSAGIIPFYKASSAVSTEERDDSIAETVGSFAKMCYRLVGHPAATVDPPVVALLLVGVAGLIGLGLRPRRVDGPDAPDVPDAGRGPRTRLRLDLLAVPLALAAGLGVTLLAGFAVRSFFVFRSTYSMWAVPGLCILAGCAFAPAPGRRRPALAALLAALAIGAEAWSVGTILAHRETFSHGPADAIERLIASAGDPPPIVVHDHGPCWVFIYYPIFLAHKDGLEQYHRVPGPGDGPPQRWALEPKAGTTRPATLEGLPRDRKILVLYGTQLGQGEIRRELKGGGVVVPDGPMIEALDRDSSWVVERELRFLAYTSVQGRLYAPRAGAATSPSGPRP